MRSKHEIIDEIARGGLTGPTIPGFDRVVLELLLDIRDLLQALQPPAIISTTEVNQDANQRLSSENPGSS